MFQSYEPKLLGLLLRHDGEESKTAHVTRTLRRTAIFTDLLSNGTPVR